MQLAHGYDGALADYFAGRLDLTAALRRMFPQPSTSATESTMPHQHRRVIEPSHVLYQPGTGMVRVPLPARRPADTAVIPRHAERPPVWLLPLVSATCGAAGGAIVLVVAVVMSRG